MLYVDDKTGASDVAFQPGNPRVMYAGMWQAYRKPWIMESGGAGSGFYKSTDGGIDLDAADRQRASRRHSRPRQCRADRRPQPHLCDDRGEEGRPLPHRRRRQELEAGQRQNQYRQRAWYFNTVFADPKKPDTLYVLNTALYRSTDAGKTFKNLHTPHGDDHELWIDPTDPQRMINGNDGGATVTVDGGETWSSEMNQPTAQFYHIATDNQFPYRLYGDQQDNTSVSIATAGRAGGVGIEDYYQVGGGESGYIVPDPTRSRTSSTPAAMTRS